MTKLIPFLLLFPISLFAVKITVINDSKYQLDTRIYDVNDQEVGSAIMSPHGHYYAWTDSRHGASDWTEGPFIVEFFCPNGEKFGRISHVADGTTVRAQGAIGPRRCWNRAPSEESSLEDEIQNQYQNAENQ